jgi:hypothetical protein
MFFSNLKDLLKNQRGVALLLVIGIVALLSGLLADATFESQINKIKSYNYQDKLQAKLTAESGIKFALAKLRLYKEAYNMLEKNKTAQSFIKPNDLESVIIQPFAFPIPLPKGASIIQRSAAEEFEEETLLRGELMVTMTSVRGFLNPNGLRIPVKKKTTDEQEEEESSFGGDSSDEEKKKKGEPPHIIIENKFVEMLKKEFEKKKETDDEFDNLYGNLDPVLLVKELKYFVNNPKLMNDSEKPDIQRLYENKNIRAKHAPMTSINEMYQLEGWPDAIVDLVKDRLSVHDVHIIQINEITKSQLKLLFPDITDLQVEEFFRRRDGDQELQEEPRPFKSVKEFKEYITGELRVLGTQDYDTRMKELESAGLRLGIAGKMYKVVSTGKYEKAVVKLTAFVDLPVKPIPVKKEKKKKKEDKKKTSDNPDGEEGEDGQDKQDKRDQEKKKKEKKEKDKIELMEPRIVEIRMD